MLVIIALTAALASAVTPAPVPAPAEPDWLVDNLTLSPEHKGPVMWRVSKGDAEVWILPSVDIPKGEPWAADQVDKVISGSRVVYTYPIATVGLLGVVGIALSGGLNQPHGRTMADIMSGPQHDRFRAVLKSVNLRPEAYERMRPAIAALWIEMDARNALKLTDPEAAITAAAKAHKVSTGPIGVYAGKPVLTELQKMPDAAALQCMNVSLDGIVFKRDHGAEAGRAWTSGDLASVRRNSRVGLTWDCLVEHGALGGLTQNSIQNTSDNVKSVLDKGGGALILIGMSNFLRRDGVLSALKAAGYRVDEPD